MNSFLFQVKGENIHKLETRRLSEGILTIILMNSLWETIVIIKADVNALRRLIRCLESLKSRAVTSKFNIQFFFLQDQQAYSTTVDA